MTVSGLQVLSTTWKSADGTASHWKYVVDNVIVYRDVYRAWASNNSVTASFLDTPRVQNGSGLLCWREYLHRFHRISKLAISGTGMAIMPVLNNSQAVISTFSCPRAMSQRIVAREHGKSCNLLSDC